MTDNTQEIDDILNVLYMQGEDIGKLEYGSATHQITAVNGAKQSIIDWHNKRKLEAIIDTLEYAKISPKFKIEERIEQLKLEMRKYE